jgi:hypothetical protein
MNSIKNNMNGSIEYHKDKKFVFKDFLSKNWRIMSGLTVAACFVFVIGSISDIGIGGRSKIAQDTEKSSRNSGAIYGEVAPSEIPKGKVALQSTEFDAQVPNVEALSNTDLEKKIIKTAKISLKVYDFDYAMQQLKSITEQAGGYVENSNSYIKYSDPEKNVHLKSGSIMLKIPSEVYNSIVTSAIGLGTVTDNNEYIEDVTSDYVDTGSLLKAKKLEEQRLLAIMEKAEKVEDLILLEQRLNAVRSELGVYEGRINNWDRLVKFSTVIITIDQEKQLYGVESVPNTLSGRVKKSFIFSIDTIKNTSADIVVGLAKILPIAIVLSVIGALVVLILKFFKRRKYKE